MLIRVWEADSPLYDAYWEERKDEIFFFEWLYQRKSLTFVKCRRIPNKVEQKRFPACIYMKYNQIGLFIVPGVYHRATEQLSFIGTVQTVLQATLHKQIS